MSFLHPELLWGLLALAIPVIVHFFYLRRSRRYEFSQALLVERLQRASRPYLRLRHLILLLLRLAVVTAIVLLFARPYWGAAAESRSEGASVLVVVDVSPSMRPAFESALTFLKEVIARDPASYEYRLLSTESYLPKGGFASGRVLIERLSQLEPMDMGLPLDALLEKADMFFVGASYTRRKVYLLSDFQRSSVGQLARIPAAALGQVVLLPVPGFSPANAYIDSLSLEGVGGGYRLRYRLASREARTYTVIIGGQKRSLPPGWYEEELPITAQVSSLQLSVEGDGVEFDNTVYVGLNLPQGEKATVVWMGPREGQAAFAKLHRVLGIAAKPAEGPGIWQSASVGVGVIGQLSEGALTWAAQGGRLVLFPPEGLTETAWPRFPLSERITYEGTVPLASALVSLRPVLDPFWEGIFIYPGRTPAFLAEPLRLRTVYRFQPQAAKPLLQDDQGHTLLWEVPWGRGQLYVFTFPWSVALAEHSLFLPLFARFYQGMRVPTVLWVARLGQRQDFFLPAEAAESPPTLREQRSGAAYIPSFERRGGELAFSVGEHPIPAGLYEVRLAEKPVRYLGVNIATQESQAEFLDAAAWEAEGFSVEVRTWEGGSVRAYAKTGGWRSWWGWLLLALALLAAETYWGRKLLKPATVPVP